MCCNAGYRVDLFDVLYVLLPQRADRVQTNLLRRGGFVYVPIVSRTLPAGNFRSPEAECAEDPYLGQTAIFQPVVSCLSAVVLVIYIQSLKILEMLDLYTDMYGQYFTAIEFYVDGTWCDPRSTSRGGYPCYGPPLNRYVAAILAGTVYVVLVLHVPRRSALRELFTVHGPSPGLCWSTQTLTADNVLVYHRHSVVLIFARC